MKNKIIICFFSVLFYTTTKAQTWMPMGTGMNNFVQSILPDTINNIVYAAGVFVTAGGNTADYIAKWNGTLWSPLGTGISGNEVTSMVIYNGDLYAGGDFTAAGGNTVSNLAKWDGTNWSDVGGGLNATVRALAVYNNELYVGGEFTLAGSTVVAYIAKWNGTTWTNVGTGMNFHVRCFTVYNNDLYAGGIFTVAGGNTVNYITKWNGSAWSALGTGVAGTGATVYAIAGLNNEIYATGTFSTAGGNNANYIAKWNGTTWSALGTGFNNKGNGIAVYKGELYVGGAFSTPAFYIAKWNGTSWSSLGTGMNMEVQAVAIGKIQVYAGGKFTTAGGSSINRMAQWGNFVGIDEELSQENNYHIYPNPATDKIYIQSFTEPLSEKEISLNLINVLGETVYTKELAATDLTTNSIDIRTFSPGMYWLRVNTEKNTVYKKIIISR